MLKEIILKHREGIWVDGMRLFIDQITRGRTPSEQNLAYFVELGKRKTPLLFAKVFFGRGPHFRPWVEVFGMSQSIRWGKHPLAYFGSALEDRLLTDYALALHPGETLHVEYQEDLETRQGLLRSFPPQVTRLGFKLWKLGFSWFKDWYFAEGEREGGLKLSANKPLDESLQKVRVQKALKEIESFLRKEHKLVHDEIGAAALKRAKALLGESTERLY